MNDTSCYYKLTQSHNPELPAAQVDSELQLSCFLCEQILECHTQIELQLKHFPAKSNLFEKKAWPNLGNDTNEGVVSYFARMCVAGLHTR